MRLPLSLAAALLAAACASAPPPAPVAAIAAVAAPRVLTIPIGAAESEVRATLGEPAVARREGAGAMWTYRRDACSVFVFFQQQAPGDLRVSSVAAGPRREGETPPALTTCLTETP